MWVLYQTVMVMRLPLHQVQQIVQIVIMRSSNDQTTKTDEISFLCRRNGLSFGDKENSSDIQRDLLRLPVSREPSIGGRWVLE